MGDERVEKRNDPRRFLFFSIHFTEENGKMIEHDFDDPSFPNERLIQLPPPLPSDSLPIFERGQINETIGSR